MSRTIIAEIWDVALPNSSNISPCESGALLLRLPPEHRAAYRAALGMDDEEDGAGQAEGAAQEGGESRPPIFIYEFTPR